MKHLGDITKINGAEIDPVDVITFGSPCQDLSVAGKRAGLAGERSGLFMEAVRIIKEMRCATDGIYPNFAIWENVPGAFSSNKGEDFRAVLEELVRIAEPRAVIPQSPNGKWNTSGAIVGNRWSLAWRILDAQFWGVPQRRRRIALVMDFGGQSAPEILFVRKGLSRDSAESGKAWKRIARDIKGGAGKSRERTYCLQGSMIGRADKNGPQGDGINTDVAFTLNATDRHAVVYGIGGFNSKGMLSDNPHTGIYTAETSRTLDLNGGNPACNQGGIAICEPLYDPAPPLDASYYKGPGERNGIERMIIAVYDARDNSDGLTAPTMTGDHQNRITDYTAILCYSRQRSDEFTENSVASTQSARQHKDATDLVCEPTVAGIDCRNLAESKVYENNQYGGYREGVGALRASEGDHGGGSENLAVEPKFSKNPLGVRIRYRVRRLTPLECERLQGYPDGWTLIPDYIDANGKKHTVSDSCRYKALGNSIALPPWKWVLKRISAQFERDAALGSLFDGIGGFPLIWERLNGAGTARWASEIEPFPIAVTKYHFMEV